MKMIGYSFVMIYKDWYFCQRYRICRLEPSVCTMVALTQTTRFSRFKYWSKV